LAAGNSSAGSLARVQHRAAFASLGSRGENGAEKLLFAFEMAEKGDFVNPGSSSDLARGGALNTAPVQGFSRSIQESLACFIGARSDEPFA
jgi:hypothetical protein